MRADDGSARVRIARPEQGRPAAPAGRARRAPHAARKARGRPGPATGSWVWPLAIPAVLALALALAGCAPPRGGPRPIATGTPCDACGMRIEDLRYACEEQREGAFRVYDSIECLLRAGPSPERAWLADYDSRALHAADSMWVVRGDIPSPMGGGYAAFLDRAAAGEIAAARSGQVGRLGEFASGRVPGPASPGPTDSVARQP